jgi:hypothetical protein
VILFEPKLGGIVVIKDREDAIKRGFDSDFLVSALGL